MTGGVTLYRGWGKDLTCRVVNRVTECPVKDEEVIRGTKEVHFGFLVIPKNSYYVKFEVIVSNEIFERKNFKHLVLTRSQLYKNHLKV